MLPLVRSQRASLERLRSALRWTRGLVVLAGNQGQGKSQVIETLTLESSTLPLALSGGSLSSRHEAILRLIGLVGFRPDGSDIDMLYQLQHKQPLSTDSGVPEVIVEDADQLPLDVVMLFCELATGDYGRNWTVLLVSEPSLVSKLLHADPLPVMPSVVLLPPWDVHDLEDALKAQALDLPSPQILTSLVAQLGQEPKRLLQQALSGATPVGESAVADDTVAPQRTHPSLVRALVAVSAMVVLILLGLVAWQLIHTEDPVTPPRSIPIPETSN